MIPWTAVVHNFLKLLNKYNISYILSFLSLSVVNSKIIPSEIFNVTRKLLSDIDYQRQISDSIFRGTTNYISPITDVNSYILDKGIETIVYVEPALTNNINSVTNDFQFADISSEQMIEKDYEILEEKSKDDVLSCYAVSRKS
jgi:hypothetical protein